MSDPEDRFWARVEKGDGCWLWTGARSGNGYGCMRVEGKVHSVHRLSYEWHIGPIPDGFTIDHVRERGCVSRLCVNPDHLEAVTNRENILRSDSACAINARKTHCDRGHEFTEENTKVRPHGRECRACAAMMQRQRRAQPRLLPKHEYGKEGRE